ncbi:MAG: Hint domain-containing protein [Pseudomonadota bacterium]
MIPGILGPTHITTSFGEVPAHLVRVRDRLRTRSGNFVPVLRVDAYRLDPEFLDGHPDARPVKVIQGSLGHNMPDKDAWYSPQQMILSATSGETHRLVPACEATNSIKATTPPAGDLAYYVFHLGQAALVRSEGMWISLGE